MIRRLTILGVLVCLIGRHAAAQDRATIRAWNVGGQTGMTLASAAIQHKIHGWHDVLRCVVAGSISGLGIYEAKSLVGRDHPRSGCSAPWRRGCSHSPARQSRTPTESEAYQLTAPSDPWR
jgi:hypothetical protein